MGTAPSAPGARVQAAFALQLAQGHAQGASPPVKAKRVSTFQEFEATPATPGTPARMTTNSWPWRPSASNTAVVMEAGPQRAAQPQPAAGALPATRGPGAPERSFRGPGGASRLVKSVSESHASCPEGGGGGRGGRWGGRDGGFPEEAWSPLLGGWGGEGPSPRRLRNPAPRASWSAETAALPLVLLAGVRLPPDGVAGGSSCGLLGAPSPGCPGCSRGPFSPGPGQPRVRNRSPPRPLPMISPGPQHVGSASAGEGLLSLESPGSDSKL